MWVSRKEWDALQMKIDNLREELEQEQLRHMLAAELQLRQWKHMRDDRDPEVEAGL